jgi:hypothetical protein
MYPRPVPRPPRSKLQKSLVGPAGEAYVLFRLYQQGMLASAAPPGSPTVDILVLSPDETIIASLQVKTRTYGREKGWHMSEKHEQIVQQRLFYALVDLEPELPATYVVPSAVVADNISSSHRAWLATPGQRGQPHRDNRFRRVQSTQSFVVPNYPNEWLEEWRERWDLLTAAVHA